MSQKRKLNRYVEKRAVEIFLQEAQRRRLVVIDHRNVTSKSLRAAFEALQNIDEGLQRTGNQAAADIESTTGVYVMARRLGN